MVSSIPFFSGMAWRWYHSLLKEEISNRRARLLEKTTPPVGWAGRGLMGQDCVRALCTKDKSEGLAWYKTKKTLRLRKVKGLGGAHTLHLSSYSFRISLNCSSWTKSSVLCGSSWRSYQQRKITDRSSGQVECTLSPLHTIYTRFNISKYSPPVLSSSSPPLPLFKRSQGSTMLLPWPPGATPAWTLPQ